MSKSKIEWTQRSWNPIRGCSRVSSGCDRCYAMGQAHRFSGPGKPFEGLTTIRNKKVDWTGIARFIPEQLAAPFSWKQPQRVFVNSMSDLFHESLSNEEIAAVFGVMAACSQHTFQVLTKRPERAAAWFRQLSDLAAGVPDGDGENRICLSMADRHTKRARHVVYQPWPLPNVWLGVSVENQKTADERIPLLVSLPAAVRFISAEPLLDRVDLSPWLTRRRDIHFSLDVSGALKNGGNSLDGITSASGKPLSRAEAKAELQRLSDSGVSVIPASPNCEGFSDQTGCPGHPKPSIDWVIVGGESGNGARPFDVAWARSVVKQCADAGVPAFVKQLGAQAIDSSLRDVWGYGYVHYTGEPDDARVLAAESRPDYRVTPHNVTRLLARDSRKGGDMSEWEPSLRVRQFPEDLR